MQIYCSAFFAQRGFAAEKLAKSKFLFLREVIGIFRDVSLFSEITKLAANATDDTAEGLESNLETICHTNAIFARKTTRITTARAAAFAPS